MTYPTRQLEPDEIPLIPFARVDGNAVVLRCRTFREASLVMEELEKKDIVVIVSDSDEELSANFKRNRYVEVRVSAQAYASIADLKTEVEFQYKLLRRELPLRNRAKVAALLWAIMPVPGILIFVGLLSDYRKHRYDRRAKEFKCWYWLGIAIYVAIVVACFAFL